MTKFEYSNAFDCTPKELNELGLKGWELVVISPGRLFYFKRPLDERIEFKNGVVKKVNPLNPNNIKKGDWVTWVTCKNWIGSLNCYKVDSVLNGKLYIIYEGVKYFVAYDIVNLDFKKVKYNGSGKSKYRFLK